MSKKEPTFQDLMRKSLEQEAKRIIYCRKCGNPIISYSMDAPEIRRFERQYEIHYSCAQGGPPPRA